MVACVAAITNGAQQRIKCKKKECPISPEVHGFLSGQWHLQDPRKYKLIKLIFMIDGDPKQGLMILLHYKVTYSVSLDSRCATLPSLSL